MVSLCHWMTPGYAAYGQEGGTCELIAASLGLLHKMAYFTCTLLEGKAVGAG